jgi:hypothetical protein
MRLSGATLEALATGQVRLRCDIVPDLDQRDLGPHFHHFAAHFVTDNPGGMDAAVGPRIPIINMGIRPAERGGFDTDDCIGQARSRIRPVDGGQPWLRRCLDERTHGPIVYQVFDPAYPVHEKNGLRLGPRDR